MIKGSHSLQLNYWRFGSLFDLGYLHHRGIGEQILVRAGEREQGTWWGEREPRKRCRGRRGTSATFWENDEMKFMRVTRDTFWGSGIRFLWSRFSRAPLQNWRISNPSGCLWGAFFDNFSKVLTPSKNASRSNRQSIRSSMISQIVLGFANLGIFLRWSTW
jgi:hypothetical protein